MTQMEVAEASGVSVNTVRRTEQGKQFGLSTFLKICEIYDYSPGVLFRMAELQIEEEDLSP